jgi:class 3 adenylate cyclase
VAGRVRGLFFSDIEGSTALLQRIGRRYTDLLVRHQEVVRAAIAAHDGVEDGTEGDSFFVTFDTPTDAVLSAVQVQLDLAREAWPGGDGIRVRIGVHVGEVRDTPAGLVGLAIHHAARIGASAHGGQVVVSDAAATMCHLDDGTQLRDLGVYDLRDAGPIRLFQAVNPELDEEFPPLRTRRTGGMHLPAPLTTLVGRKLEIDDVDELLRNHRLVTLTGPGGTGKTRLALQVAARSGDRFEDGVWFVDLAPLRDDDHVLATIVGTIGAGTGIDALADLSLLLVLDNCEQVIAGAATAAHSILETADGVDILATSREALTVSGEAVYRVPALTVPVGFDPAAVLASEAGQLYVDRARSTCSFSMPLGHHARHARRGRRRGRVVPRGGHPLDLQRSGHRTPLP